MQVCSLKSSQGGAPAELVLDPISASASSQGWSVDALKVTAAPGERKPLKFTLAVPRTPVKGSAAALGLQEYAELHVQGTGSGGMPAMLAGTRFQICVSALVVPEQAAVSSAGPEDGKQKKGGRGDSGRATATPEDGKRPKGGKK